MKPALSLMFALMPSMGFASELPQSFHIIIKDTKVGLEDFSAPAVLIAGATRSTMNTPSDESESLKPLRLATALQNLLIHATGYDAQSAAIYKISTDERGKTETIFGTEAGKHSVLNALNSIVPSKAGCDDAAIRESSLLDSYLKYAAIDHFLPTSSALQTIVSELLSNDSSLSLVDRPVYRLQCPTTLSQNQNVETEIVQGDYLNAFFVKPESTGGAADRDGYVVVILGK